MTIRIRKLDDGYLVTDARGPVLWEGAAVSEADAVVMAENRLNPRLPAPPPGMPEVGKNLPDLGTSYPPEACGVVQPVIRESSPARDAPEPSPLAMLQYAQATDGAECVGGLCSMD